MLFHASPARTTQNMQPTANAFAEFTAGNPHLHLDSVMMSAGTVTIHLQGAHALEHLAHWEEVLGNCARSSDSFPSALSSGLHYTERRAAVVAGTAFEVVAIHDGPGAHDPHHMVRSGDAPTTLVRHGGATQIPARPTGAVRPRVAVLTAALAVTTVVTAAAICRRVKAARQARIPTSR